MSHLHFYSATLPDNEANGPALSVQFRTTEISKPYKGTSLTFSTQHLPACPPPPRGMAVTDTWPRHSPAPREQPGHRTTTNRKKKGIPTSQELASLKEESGPSPADLQALFGAQRSVPGM